MKQSMKMKQSKKLLTNRLIVSAFLILLQVCWIILLLVSMRRISRILTYLMTLLSFIAVLYIVNKDDENGYKIVWIILILSFPVFGGFLYLLFGNKKPAKKMRLAFEKQLSYSKQFVDKECIGVIEDQDVKGQMRYLASQTFPMYQNNEVTYFSLGDQAYPQMLEELKKAKRFIFMEYFIVDEGKMFDGILEILKEKVKEGVEVRFMYDDVGCITMLDRHYYQKLRQYGIKSVAFNPFVPLVSLVMNNRDHRKITVIDGKVAFCGGYNLADEYINVRDKYGHWKDSGIMIKGSAVWPLCKMFLETWNVANHGQEDYTVYRVDNPLQYHQDGYIIPYGDSPLDEEPVGEMVYLNMINQAHDYLYIDSPYLILTNALQMALINAVKRGVDVRICTPGIPDKKIVFKMTRSYYPTLVKNGIRIYEYSPGFNHAKNFVCDDKVATVGTINLDYRSLYLHFECGLYLYKNPVIMKMKQDFLDSISKSHEITLKEVETGRFRGLFEVILRVFAPLV